MADYIKSFENSNNLERRYQATSMLLAGIIASEYAIRDSVTGLPKEQEVLKVDDLVAIGKLASKTLVMNCRIIVHEAFATGTKISLYSQADFPDNTPIVISEDIVVDNSNATIQVRLPNLGVRLEDDTALPSTENGNIWVGDNKGFFVVAKLTGTSVSDIAPKGIIEIMFDYVDFGANNGSFTGE